MLGWPVIAVQRPRAGLEGGYDRSRVRPRSQTSANANTQPEGERHVLLRLIVDLATTTILNFKHKIFLFR